MARSDPSACPWGEVPTGDEALRVTIARGIYDARPFRIARSGGVMEMMAPASERGWDEAPAWYRDECLEIADAVLARMLLAQQADQAGALDCVVDAARAA